MVDHLALIRQDLVQDLAPAMVAGMGCCGRKVTPSIMTASVDPMHPVMQIRDADPVKTRTSFIKMVDLMTEVAVTT